MYSGISVGVTGDLVVLRRLSDGWKRFLSLVGLNGRGARDRRWSPSLKTIIQLKSSIN